MKKPETKKTATKKTATKTPEREYLKDPILEVSRVKMWDNGGVTFDLTVNGVKIYGCRVVEGKNGDFIGFPSRKGSDGKYYSYAYAALDPDATSLVLSAVEEELNGGES